MDQVLYARFRIPGNFVGMRSDTRMARYMSKTARSVQDNRKTSSRYQCALSKISIPPESTEQSDADLDHFDAYRGHVCCVLTLMKTVMTI